VSNGQDGGYWLDAEQKAFVCNYPEGFDDPNYYCSYNQPFNDFTDKGLDLSTYERINVKLRYQGAAPKLRLFARNFNSQYSKIEDTNSTKYNAIFLPSANLNNEISLDLKEFVVTEWWLIAYKIPLQQSQPDLSNVVTLGIDFSYPMVAGEHKVSIEKIEFVKNWISRDIWYLGILSIWLAGIFIYAVNQLRILRIQSKHDIEMINQLNQSNQQLMVETKKYRKLSTIDPLTQTFNRFGIEQIVSNLIPSDDLKKPLVENICLILLDIDHFKRINDNRGHDAGDRVLKKIAEIVQLHLNEESFVGRWGGEEFLIVAPNMLLNTAADLAEKIRGAIESATFEPSKPIPVTASFGVGNLLKMEDFASCFKRVDDALYSAKNLGRNCVIQANVMD
jgi:diguanylate cyclase (GGDEF)-like protein